MNIVRVKRLTFKWLPRESNDARKVTIALVSELKDATAFPLRQWVLEGDLPSAKLVCVVIVDLNLKIIAKVSVIEDACAWWGSRSSLLDEMFYSFVATVGVAAQVYDTVEVLQNDVFVSVDLSVG